VVALHLTRRSLIQLQEIHTSSIAKHGEAVAELYMQKIEDGLNLIAEYPALLLERPYTASLRFYPVAKHMLICTVIENEVYVLAVQYGGCDVESMMRHLEGTLVQEAHILHQKVHQKRHLQ
jgi:toxin ParE1/3/4